jgi:adenylate cyclase class IV
MARNVEWKARSRDPQRQQQLARQLAGGPPASLKQVDTFFNVPNGYLKLRQFSPKSGELIYYVRPVQAGPKLSNYSRVPTERPGLLCQLLAQALGICGEVRKRRRVYIVGQTRIHFDQVEGLGNFLEVEVVLRPKQTVAEGKRIAASLRRELAVRQDELVEEAYIALLTRKS